MASENGTVATALAYASSIGAVDWFASGTRRSRRRNERKMVTERVITWCAVTRDGSILGEGNLNIEYLYHLTSLERILHQGKLPLCKNRLAAKEICKQWNKGRPVNWQYWAKPKKMVFEMKEV